MSEICVVRPTVYVYFTFLKFEIFCSLLHGPVESSTDGSVTGGEWDNGWRGVVHCSPVTTAQPGRLHPHLYPSSRREFLSKIMQK